MADSEDRAFVAGATGYTGRAVVAALRDRGVSVVAHVRPDSSRLDAHRQAFAAQGATVDTAPWTPEAIAESIRGHAPTLAFGLLGTTRKRISQERSRGEAALGYDEVDVGMTLMVLRACEALDPPPRFVYLSAMGAGGSGGNAYIRARTTVEAALQGSEVPWTIARPSFIAGSDREESRPGEQFAAAAADVVLGGLARLGVTGPRDRWTAMTGTVLARALVDAALDPGCEGVVLEADALRRRGG